MGIEGPFADKAGDRFEIFRAEKVRMTTTLFAGGDWHWRLANRASETLAEAGGYRTEADCREAVAMLRERAAFAWVSDAALTPA